MVPFLGATLYSRATNYMLGTALIRRAAIQFVHQQRLRLKFYSFPRHDIAKISSLAIGVGHSDTIR